MSGFYWAVVETLPRPTEGEASPPSLPGPKPRDYHFTTRTDSVFVFSVAEDIPDRQHAFFIYAVDNGGKPDPTPARFIFNAEDRFPPIPQFDDCTCTGTVYQFVGGSLVPQTVTNHMTESEEDNRFLAPRDTCPSNSILTFRWHGLPVIPQIRITGYRYKLEETRFQDAGPEVTSKSYFTGVGADTIAPSPGTKIFRLRVVDEAFGSQDSTRRFQYNYSPDTWYSGPDPNSPSLSVKPNGERYALLINGSLPPGGIQGSLLSPDSVRILPALRPERRTFFEVWQDTVFLRADGDTVHMNSWVIFHSGGFDRDSRYRVAVSDLARQLPGFPSPPAPVLDPGPPNGSPVGMRSQTDISLSPFGNPTKGSISGPYPIFDPNDVFNQPTIGRYEPVVRSGRAFAYTFAVDGDGAPDRRITDPRGLVLKVESGQGTPYEGLLREKVLAFYVNRAPNLVTDSPVFSPRVSVLDTFTTPVWNLHLVADDEDPFLARTTPGGPSSSGILRWRITIIGHDSQGREVKETDPTTYLNQDISVLVPAGLAGGPAIVQVELCDCELCEEIEGSGRCRTTDIPVFYQPSSPAQPASTNLSRPGSGVIPPQESKP